MTYMPSTHQPCYWNYAGTAWAAGWCSWHCAATKSSKGGRARAPRGGRECPCIARLTSGGGAQRVTIRPSSDATTLETCQSFRTVIAQSLSLVGEQRRRVCVQEIIHIPKQRCGYIATTPLDEAGSRVLQVQVEDGRHLPRALELRLRARHFDLQSIWLEGDKVRRCKLDPNLKAPGFKFQS